ncbi:MAG: DUF3379 family protein [Pseudomonadota bacterium]
MNCEEFQRKLHEDPKRREPEFLAHRASCASCAREAEKVDGLEKRLDSLLKVPPPAGLHERLRRPSQRRRAALRVPLAMAASFIMGMAVALSVFLWNDKGRMEDHVTEVVFQHVQHEPAALPFQAILTWEEVDDVSPTVSVAASGQDPRPGYGIVYAEPCVIMKDAGLHLVVLVSGSHVSVMLVPDVQVEAPRLVYSDGKLAAVYPAQAGTLAVVGGDDVPVEALARELAQYFKVRT